MKTYKKRKTQLNRLKDSPSTRNLTQREINSSANSPGEQKEKPCSDDLLLFVFSVFSQFFNVMKSKILILEV